MNSKLLACKARVWGADQTSKAWLNYPSKHRRGHNPNYLMVEVWIQQEVI